jgi:hypothetical protein
MSAVQPPGWPAPLSTPCGANGPPGTGQVVAVGAMNVPMLNGALVKLLLIVVLLDAESVQVTGCGGDARLTSF